MFSHFLELSWFMLANPLPATLPGVSSNPSLHLCPENVTLYIFQNQKQEIRIVTFLSTGNKVLDFLSFGLAILVNIAPS